MILDGEVIQEDSLEGELTSEDSLEGDMTPEESLEGDMQPSARVNPYSHPDLVMRDAPDQHPQNAITNLAEDMAARPKDIITDSEIWNL